MASEISLVLRGSIVNSRSNIPILRVKVPPVEIVRLPP
jgi:hypothetical protein